MRDLDWNRLFARYEAVACAFAGGLAGHRDAGRDLFQEAARAVLERQLRGDLTFESEAHARNYLFRVIRNLAIDQRRDSPGVEFDEGAVPDPAPGPDARAELADRDARLAQAIASLRTAEREAVRWRYIEGLTYREIAERTHEAISTLQARVESALQKIRERIGNSFP